MHETEIVDKCKQGDRMAYKKLYETYSPHLMGICLRYVVDRDLAHDVLHDSFIKIIGAINSFQYRGEGSLKAWISRITVNMSLTHLQNNKFLDFSDQVESYEQLEDEADESFYDQVSDKVVMQFIHDLPDGCRTVFNMYMLENMSHSEISKQLGIKEVASRVRLTRARGIVADKIKKYVEQENK